MMNRDPSEIAQEWLEVWSGSEPAAIAPGEGGASILDWELPLDYPDLCRKVILEVLATLGPDYEDKKFGVLAAGPLEDLMSNHGEALIERVEDQARTDPSFALLLGGVWRSTIEQSVWDRMQLVAKGGW